MKYVRFLAVALLCCLLIAVPAMALPGVADISGDALVASDGSCGVRMTVRMVLETAQSELAFPLPADAENVQLGGQEAQVRLESDRLLVLLPSLSAGEHTLYLQYSLPCQVQQTKEETLLTLPILNGFPLPIENLEFSVTLPGAITGQPLFNSGYHQENIRVDTVVSGSTLTAKLTDSLKDHETLSLELPVDEALFDLVMARQRLLSRWDVAAMVLLAVAMLYFCIFLLPKITRQSRSYTAPAGISAGEVGSCLTGCGTDLIMMVLSWAQMGYILVEQSRNGRVLLHKRMEMGNERSYHEGRIFQLLFGRRYTVDTTGVHFARLARKVSGRSPLLKQLYKPNSGNLHVFQGLCTAAGFCCGVQLVPFGFWAVVLGLLTAVLSYCIQSGGKCIPLRNKLPLWVGLGCGLVWIFIGGLTHSLSRVVPMVLFQYVAGIFVAYGGKRSELGQRALAQMLGLRRHMTGATTFDMQMLQQKNPDYFHEMLPYALAMGVDRQFARRFEGKEEMPDGGWLKNAPPMNPQRWATRLRQVADSMQKACRRQALHFYR